MRHSSKRLLLTLLAVIVLAWQAQASPVLRNLQISVDLRDNGDAEIVETRVMDIDDVGTECYIVIGNLEGSTIKDFSVTDEAGNKFVNTGSWDVDRSRQQKTNQCGIVKKGDGVELCWGLGRAGTRIYTVRYVVTDFVRAYEESDGFNWMFVTRNMSPSPMSARVTISSTQYPDGLPEDSISIWGFGYEGETSIEDGEAIASTTQPMTSSSAMIVMMEFQKGILHPNMSEDKSFKDVRKEAFEGSDYEEETALRQFVNAVKQDPEVIFTLLFFVVLGVVGIWAAIRKKLERRRLEKMVTWFRDIPIQGNLKKANDYLMTYSFMGDNTNNLISAMVLRLIRTGTLRVENRYVEASGLKKIFGGEGKNQDCIIIGTFNENNRLINDPTIHTLYDMMRLSAGDDGVLQPKELKHWMHNHSDEVIKFLDSIKAKTSFKEAKQNIEDVKNVFGLKKFLSDFTLANERHLSEVALWNDYLVYATLFGIADQVKADMAAINPEYLNMNEIARNLTNNTVVPMLTAATFQSARSVEREVRSRDSGGGGRSSFGGGGGFHGGGSGGGVR